MASFRKRGNTWEVRISYKDKDGKHTQKAKGGFRTKKEAQMYGNELEQQLNDGKFIVENVAFPEYFWNWFNVYKNNSVGPKTYKTYEHVYHTLQNKIPQIPVSEMTRKKYQEFINNYGKSHAKATMYKMNSLIRACVDNAVYDGDIKKDFTKNVEIVYNKSRTMKIEYLNIDEMNRLVDYIYNKLDVNYTSNFMILTAIYTGMRLGEIQGLQWQDINWNFKTISVKRAWDDDNKKFKDTKNESSVRTIRINSTLLSVLKKLKDAYQPQKDDRVFLNQFEGVPSSTAVNKVLRKDMASVKINRAGFHFHSLRHTHVSYLLANKIDLYVISKRLGHSDIATTSRVYSYLIDEYKTKTDNQIENVLDMIDVMDKNYGQNEDVHNLSI